MPPLFNDQFAPTTSTIGFLRLPLGEAQEALVGWRQGLHGADAVTVRTMSSGLAPSLKALAPLTGGVRPRELLVATASPEWTAYFDCSISGTDAESTIGYLSTELECEGLYVTSVPHTYGPKFDGPGRYGAVKLTMFGPNGTPPLMHVRVVGVVHDGSRWVFEDRGEVQPFEDPSRYAARKLRDRFDDALLAQYCATLGLRPFDEHFYEPQATLVESAIEVPRNGHSLTFSEAQERLGIL